MVNDPAHTELKYTVEGLAQIHAAAKNMERLVKTHLDYAKVTSKGAIDSNMQRVVEQTRKVRTETQRVLVSWQSVGRIIIGSLISRGLGKLMREIRASLEDVIEFEIRVSELQTISHDAALAFDTWADSVYRLSEAWAAQPLDVIEGIYQTLSNQVAEGAEAIIFMDEALRLSIITVSTTEQAVQALTGAINSFHMSTSDARYVADVFFKMVEEGRLRLQDISNTMGRVNMLADQLGVKLEENAAALATLTRQGVPANEAMTYLRNIFLKMIRPTDRMKELFAEWGVTSAKAAIETFGFTGAMERLREAVEKSDDSLAELGELFQRIRAITGASGFVGNLDLYKSTLEEIMKAADDANQALEERLAPSAFKVKQEFIILQNQIRKLGQDVLDMLEKAIVKTGGLRAIIESTRGVFENLVVISIFGLIAVTTRLQTLIISWRALRAIIMSTTIQGMAVFTATYLLTKAWLDALDARREAARGLSEEEIEIAKMTAARILAVRKEQLSNETRAYELSLEQQHRRFKLIHAAQMKSYHDEKMAQMDQATLESSMFDLQLKYVKRRSEGFALIEKRYQRLKTLMTARLGERDYKGAMDIKTEIDALLATAKAAGYEWQQYRRRDIVELRGTQERLRVVNVIAEKEKEVLGLMEQAYAKMPGPDRMTADWEVLTERLKRKADSDAAIAEGTFETLDAKVKDSNKRVIDLTEQIANSYSRVKAEFEALNSTLNTTSVRVGVWFQSDTKEFGIWEKIIERAQKYAEMGPVEFSKLKPEEISYELDMMKRLNDVLSEMHEKEEDTIAIKHLDQLQERVETYLRFIEERQRILAQAETERKAIQEEIKQAPGQVQQMINKTNELKDVGKQAGDTLKQSYIEAGKVIENNILKWERAISAFGINLFTWKGGYFASGGSVASDTIPAMLSKGEFVMNKNAARQFLPQLVAMNTGVSRFDSGGQVVNNNIGDINVTVQGGDTSEITTRRIASSLRRELKRGTIRLN